MLQYSKHAKFHAAWCMEMQECLLYKIREQNKTSKIRMKKKVSVLKRKQGILVVSFGTSYEETRKKTIEAIENRIRESFEDYAVYRAFTSKIILKKLKKSGMNVYSVQEALEAMVKDGITDEIIIQPTHVINGIENDFMLEEVEKYKKHFKRIKYGKPLLTQPEDYEELAKIIKNTYPVDKDEALVLMGHGSEHHSNSAYPAFEYVLKNLGYGNIFVGTVEGYPSLEEVKIQLKRENMQKACLVPMMIVAGDHANNDMAGNDDSWKAELEQEGYPVRYWLKGLGEIREVQDMFVKHVKEAVKEG